MKMNEYQELAARTINKSLIPWEQTMHSLHLISAESGEIHGIFQKKYQGHAFDAVHLMKEVGDLLWGIAELCTAFGWGMDEVAEMNIQKLKERYPAGFDADKSLHRKDGDA